MTRDEKQAVLEHHLAENAVGWWCPDGWIDLAYATHKALLDVAPDYRIIEIKEKFGQMRYYATIRTAEVITIIRAAEDMSLSVCQNCGNTHAETIDAGWVATLCQQCATDPAQPRGYPQA